jgi:hypothetical protein
VALRTDASRQGRREELENRTVPLSDRTKRHSVLLSTAWLPRPLRIALGRRLLANLELGRARRARLIIIGHPKSGNTWLRTMISRLYQVRLGMRSDFTVKTDELALRNPAAPRLLASNGYYTYEGVIGQALAEDAPDSELKRKPIVLLARNPGDIAVSWYYQFTRRQSARKRELINAFIEQPIDPERVELWEFVRNSELGLPSLIEFLNAWERRVTRLENAIIVRYEDLRSDTASELSRITSLLGEHFSDAEIREAVEWTSFDNMQRMETDGHFQSGGVQLLDRDDPTTRKVRRGKVGGFRDDFAADRVNELEALIATRLSPTFGYAKGAARLESEPTAR